MVVAPVGPPLVTTVVGGVVVTTTEVVGGVVVTTTEVVGGVPNWLDFSSTLQFFCINSSPDKFFIVMLWRCKIGF